MQHLQPNTTLQGGKYRIEQVLGQGGFGITYLATQLSLQRQVAVKEFFMKDFYSRDESIRTMSAPSTGSSKLVEQYRKKFIKEARNLARLNHPHIISVIDVYEENGTVYYVMPYLIGGSLQDYVKTHGTLSEQEAMKYVKQIASALKYMHEELHICHYDVKPANILLDNKGNAVLIDFGISKNYDAQGQETTTTPIGMSEGYAPIEQYQQNVEEFSPVSDVYALGATLYFLLHGKRPVSAVHRASGEKLLMRSTLSKTTKSIISLSMKVSKNERSQSVDIFENIFINSKKSLENDTDEDTFVDNVFKQRQSSTMEHKNNQKDISPLKKTQIIGRVILCYSFFFPYLFYLLMSVAKGVFTSDLALVFSFVLASTLLIKQTRVLGAAILCLSYYCPLLTGCIALVFKLFIGESYEDISLSLSFIVGIFMSIAIWVKFIYDNYYQQHQQSNILLRFIRKDK